MGDLLFSMPGVQVQSRNNPTQDARIAVRGFGARSAFGVRGVKVLRDGIPLTLPDGQTPMDWLDLETVGTRGGDSRHGGGALRQRGRRRAGLPHARRRRGAVGRRGPHLGRRRCPSHRSCSAPARGPGTAGADSGATTWLASVPRTRAPTGRASTRGSRRRVLFARARGTVGKTRLRLLASGFDMPLAQNPGALTEAELARDVRLPDSLNITRGANKTVRHAQLGVVAEQGTADRGLAAAAWVGARDLDNPLPFAVVTVDRVNSGLWVRGTSTHRRGDYVTRVSAGLDVQSVRDDRQNRANCFGAATSANCPVAGSDRGVLRLDQQEEVQSEGAFVRYELAMPHGLEVSAALRFDQIRFRLTDRFITATDRDDSGEQSQTAVNPMVGLTWRVRPALSVYGTFSTAFETPSVTELTTQADGSAGLNADLSPQRTRTLEAGVRGVVGTRTWLDLSVFTARSEDELIPFDVPNVPGRRAFRNAGRTSRYGLEASARTAVGAGDVGVAYTASRFRFTDYEVDGVRFDGNAIPGIPSHQVQGWVDARGAGAGSPRSTCRRPRRCR